MNRRDVLRGVLPAAAVAPIALSRAGFVGAAPRAVDAAAGVPALGMTLAASSSPAGPYVFVGDYGAVGDGTSDDSLAVQQALDAALASGLPLVFGHGVYRVEGLIATNADQLTICGQGQRSTTLMLRDDDGLGGIGQVLVVTDVIGFALFDITVHGNFAGAKAGAPGKPLVEFRTTAATRAREDFSAVIENVDLIESAKGFGQIYVRVEEIAEEPYSRWSQVIVRNIRSIAHGNSGPAVQIHGPADFVQVEAITTRNDGPYGLECYGPVTYPGSNAKPLAISCDKDFNHFIRHAVVTGVSSFRDNGALFVQRIKRLDASSIVIAEDCTNPFFDTPPIPVDADPASDFLTATFPSGGYGNSTVVRLSSTGTLPKPLVAGQLYFVRDRSGDAFRLANSSGGAAINIADSGAGAHAIEFLGYTYTSAVKADDNLHTPEDPVVHRFSDVSVIRSSPHTGNRNFSWDETLPATTGRVVLEDCSFVRPISIPNHFPGQAPTVRRCTVNMGWAPNVSYGTASPIHITDGVIEDCVINGNVTISQSADLTIRQNRFASGLRHVMAAGASGILRMHDNVWNVADRAPATVLLSAPRSGGKLLIEMRGNRVPQGAAHATTARLSTADTTGLTVSARDNDVVVAF